MERGRIYGKFTASYGEAVEVRGSSGTSEPQCWIEVNTAANKNDYMGGERVEANALLSVPEAIVLRAALDSFIAQAGEDEG